MTKALRTQQGAPPSTAASGHGNCRWYYFHGLPGSAAELELAPEALRGRLTPFPGQGRTPLRGDDLAKVEAGQPVGLIGFSLGAFNAISVAAAGRVRVEKLVLIAPAGPLEMGPFLDRMAGAPIFRIARFSTGALAALTALQGGLANVAPSLLLKSMFRTGCIADKALLKDPAVVDVLTRGLNHSLNRDRRNYLDSVQAYTRAWRHLLGCVTCPVEIFQGREDTWTPPDMAEAIAHEIGKGVELKLFDGLGHYSTLVKVLPDIIEGVGEGLAALGKVVLLP